MSDDFLSDSFEKEASAFSFQIKSIFLLFYISLASILSFQTCQKDASTRR